MIVRNIRPAGSEIHEEKAVHHIGRGEFVAGAGSEAHQQLELRGGAVTAKNLKRHIIGIRQHQFGRRIHLMPAGILYPITITLTGASEEFATSVPDADRQVQEVVLLYRHLLVAIQQGSAAILDEVHLLFGGIADDGRVPPGATVSSP